MPDIRIEQSARLIEEWGRILPFEFHIHTDAIVRPTLPGLSVEMMKTLDVSYIETAAKQQFLNSSMTGNSGKIIQHITHFGDGRKFTTVEYRQGAPEVQQRVTIGSSFGYETSHGGTARPAPVAWFFVDKTPLPEALPSSVSLGTREYLGKTCQLFLFKDVPVSQGRLDQVYYLQDESVFPLRVVAYVDEAARLADRPRWFWEATKLGDVQGHILPMTSRTVNFDPKDTSQQNLVDAITIEKAEFGKSFAPSIFQPVISPEAMVFDSLSGKTTMPAARPVTAVADPIRVPPTSSNSGPVMIACVVAGIVAILAGLWLRARHS